MGKPKTIGLTPRQRDTLLIIKKLLKIGYPPTIAEIATGVGSKAHLNVRRHLDALVEKGYIARTPGISRGIRVLR